MDVPRRQLTAPDVPTRITSHHHTHREPDDPPATSVWPGDHLFRPLTPAAAAQNDVDPMGKGKRRSRRDGKPTKARRPKPDAADGALAESVELPPVTAGLLLREVRALFGAVGSKAALTVTLVELPLVVLLLIGDPSGGVLPVLYGLVTIVGAAAAIHLALQHLRREKTLSMKAALGRAVSCWIGLIAAGLIAGLMIMAFALALVIPGVMRALSYALIAPLIVSGDAYGIDACDVSRRRMKGHRWPAFFAYLVAWLPAVAWQAAYLMFVDVEQVLGRAPAVDPELGERLVAAGFTALYPLCDLPLSFLSVALYWQLRRRAGGR